MHIEHSMLGNCYQLKAYGKHNKDIFYIYETLIH